MINNDKEVVEAKEQITKINNEIRRIRVVKNAEIKNLKLDIKEIERQVKEFERTKATVQRNGDIQGNKKKQAVNKKANGSPAKN